MNGLQKAAAAVLALVVLSIAVPGCGETPTPAPTATSTAVPPTPTPVPTPTPDLVAMYTEDGWELLWNSDFSGAEAAFEMALEFDEDAAAVYKGLATVYYYIPGRNEDGLEAAERATELAPADAEARAALAWALLDTYQFEESLAAAEEAAALDTANALAQAALADVLRTLNRQEDALKAALRAVETDSGCPLARSVLAAVYSEMWRKNETLAEAHTAAALQPGFAPRWLDLAEVYTSLLDDEFRAREYITKALSLASDYVPALSKLAAIEAEADKYERASALCKRIKELAPDASAGYVCQGDIYIQRESFDDALAEYETALELDPDSPWVLFGLAWTYQMQGDCDQAAAEYEMLTEKYPRFDGGHTGLALATLCSDEPDEALVHAEEALALQPYLPIHRMTLSLVHTALEEFDEAEAMIREALEIDADDGFLWSQLAFVSTQQGHRDEAIRHLEHAVALDPDDGGYQFQLGWHLWASGDYGRALEHLEQAFELGEDDDNTFGMLGLVQSLIGSLDEASRIYAEGLERYPDSVELHLGRGDLLIREDRCEEAIAEYEWVLKSDPENELATAGTDLCESILNPMPTPAAGTAPTGGVTHATGRQMAVAAVERAGATFGEAAIETVEGEPVWAVAYISQHAAGSAEFDTQQIQIVLAVSDVAVRLDPPVVGLGVVALDAAGAPVNIVFVLTELAKMWQEGNLTDEGFMDLWFIEAY